MVIKETLDVKISNTEYVPGSKLLVLGIVIPPLIGNPYNGYINPYYWVDEFIPTIGKQWELIDPSTYESRKKPSYFPLYWMVNRDPYNGLL